MAVVQDLPVELLACIFKYLYMSHRMEDWFSSIMFHLEDDKDSEPETVTTVWRDRGRHGEHPFKNLKEPSLFPCAVARVCRLWQGVMMRTPEYWTRFAFDISSDEPLLLEAFQWAKDLPYDVLIFDSRHADVPLKSAGLSQADEFARVSAVTNALLPHLQRCLALKYDVNFSTSLPSLPLLLQRTNETITRLKLRHLVKGSVTLDQHRETCIDIQIPVSYRSLQRLCISVDIFMEMAQLDESWWGKFNINHGLILKLLNHEFSDTYTESDGQHSVTDFLEQLDSMHCLSSLYLRNIGLQQTKRAAASRKPRESRQPQMSLNRFECDNVSRSFLSTFFSKFGVSAEDVCFRSCRFPRNTQLAYIFNMHLHHLPLDARPERLLTSAHAYISSISVLSSPCFDDEVLDLLADEDKWGNACFAPNLDELNFINCDAFTLDALKNLVEVRKNIFDEAGEDSLDSSCITSLEMRGKVPAMTPEDIRWFEQNIPTTHLPLPQS